MLSSKDVGILTALAAAGEQGCTGADLVTATGFKYVTIMQRLLVLRDSARVTATERRPIRFYYCAESGVVPAATNAAERFTPGAKVPTVRLSALARPEQPDTVRITRAPSFVDNRFTVDPASFAGGDFMADWRARRAGGAH